MSETDDRRENGQEPEAFEPEEPSPALPEPRWKTEIEEQIVTLIAREYVGAVKYFLKASDGKLYTTEGRGPLSLKLKLQPSQIIVLPDTPPELDPDLGDEQVLFYAVRMSISRRDKILRRFDSNFRLPEVEDTFANPNTVQSLRQPRRAHTPPPSRPGLPADGIWGPEHFRLGGKQ